MFDVPSTAHFYNESTECFPAMASKFFVKPFVITPIAPIITGMIVHFSFHINPLNPELNPIYLLALLGAHHFLHVSRIRVKLLTFRRLMSFIYIYIYGAPILDVSRSHTTTQHSR